MPVKARYVHTNLIARDWRRLARFYEVVFGCTVLAPERALRGPALDAATGLQGVEIEGVHLLLPGLGANGPTLEIFSYNLEVESPGSTINRRGLAHIAFTVDDVGAAKAVVLAGGGSAVGEVVSVEVHGAGTVTFAYVTDPEGNIIELQSWATQSSSAQPDGSPSHRDVMSG